MTETIHISGTDFRAASGKFDSRKRYLRGAAVGADFPIPKGKTVDVNRVPVIDTTGTATAIRYSVNGFVRESTVYANSPDLIDPPDFDAVVELVKL